jgi:hypothetical protein
VGDFQHAALVRTYSSPSRQPTATMRPIAIELFPHCLLTAYTHLPLYSLFLSLSFISIMTLSQSTTIAIVLLITFLSFFLLIGVVYFYHHTRGKRLREARWDLEKAGNGRWRLRAADSAGTRKVAERGWGWGWGWEGGRRWGARNEGGEVGLGNGGAHGAVFRAMPGGGEVFYRRDPWILRRPEGVYGGEWGRREARRGFEGGWVGTGIGRGPGEVGDEWREEGIGREY